MEKNGEGMNFLEISYMASILVSFLSLSVGLFSFFTYRYSQKLADKQKNIFIERQVEFDSLVQKSADKVLSKKMTELEVKQKEKMTELEVKQKELDELIKKYHSKEWVQILDIETCGKGASRYQYDSRWGNLKERIKAKFIALEKSKTKSSDVIELFIRYEAFGPKVHKSVMEKYSQDIKEILDFRPPFYQNESVYDSLSLKLVLHYRIISE